MQKNFTKSDFYNLLKLGGPNGDCLEWTMSCHPQGYGLTGVNGKLTYTHRLALMLDGIDPSNKMVLHSCDNTKCCNPKHLRLGDHTENMKDVRDRGLWAGEKNSQAKLADSDIPEMIKLRQQGMSIKDIAKKFKISVSHTYFCLKGNRLHPG